MCHVVPAKGKGSKGKFTVSGTGDKPMSKKKAGKVVGAIHAAKAARKGK